MRTKKAQNEHWTECLATFEEYCYPDVYALDYKARLISTSTNFLQPSPDSHRQVDVIILYSVEYVQG